ncbi:sensor domain-containing protein [Mycobacterium sp. 663a-19]|uniref:sensor domain-containing protein n=1 Tax=Mycobacterium sp. 663a-19 TaxID=2986148 RepID=UPI002D1E518E|nr:sensor domain-containing protein [Mycobacterium sp. 663a-19]MEB3979788.1 sensor domain-containing protein [Mycobacterium sp. 663a-19]
MALFISYSSQDRSTVDALTTALRRAQQQVWFDQELGGGDSWWAKILEQIRACDVFVVALSSNWLQSKPSQSELRYAQTLNRPILPVRIGDIGSMRVNPLAALQIIDYRNPTVDAGIQLVTAIHSLTAKPQPLPDPLPEEPPVPFGYITRLGNVLAEKELSPQQQLQLLVELRSGLDEDGDDPSARSDIAQLLRMMRLRHDVTYRTRNDIDNVLATIEAGEPDSSRPSATPAANAQTAPTASAGTGAQPAAATTVGGGAGKDGASNRRLIIIGGAALAVIVAIVAVVLMTQSGAKKKPASARATASAAPAAEVPGQAAPVQAAPAPEATQRLVSILLSGDQLKQIMGGAPLTGIGPTTQLRPDWALSDPACLGPFDAIFHSVYDGSGYTGVYGEEFNPQGADRIFEAAVSFPTPDQARAFVKSQAEYWRGCNGKTVTVGEQVQWTFENPTGDSPRITQLRTKVGGKSTCQRVLSAVSDVVLDVRACAPNIADQGGQIADAMAANVK